MADIVKFDITLSGTYWDRKPEYKISIGEEVVHHEVISSDSDEQFTVSFEKELEEGKCELVISLLNKQDSDTIQSEDKSSIINDMLLNIDKLEVDGIDVGELKWTKSTYEPYDRESLDGCVNLGWNGDWKFKFEVPYYVWLIENM